jgi:hypothetical protein
MTATDNSTRSLNVLKLSAGRHASAKDGMCVMEATAFLAGEKHSDGPLSACPVLGAYLRLLNDIATFSQRQDLLPFIPRLIGSTSKKHMHRRAQYLVRQAVTVFLPLMYDRLGLTEIAAALRTLPKTARMGRLYEAAKKAADGFQPAKVVADAAATATLYAEDHFYSVEVAAQVSRVYRYIVSMYFEADGSDTKQKLWQAALAALEGALAIGPSGPTKLTPEMEQRLETYAELVGK